MAFLSYERIWRSLFYWVWNVLSVKEGEGKHFNLMEGKHKHSFIIHYELGILKNRNRITDTYLSIIFQGKVWEERRKEKWLHTDGATRQWSGIGVLYLGLQSGRFSFFHERFHRCKWPKEWMWNTWRTDVIVKKTIFCLLAKHQK